MPIAAQIMVTFKARRIESDDDNVGATAEYPTTSVDLINMCREALKIEA